MRFRPAVLYAVLTVLPLTLLAAGPAVAHDFLTASTPARGAVLLTSPQKVSFTFDAPVQESSYDTIAVTGPDMTHWAVSDLRISGNTMSAVLGALGPRGRYTLAYRLVSADGHPTGGAITVTLARPGPGKPMTRMAEEADQSGSGGGGGPAWIWLAGLVVVVAAALARVRGRRPTEVSP